MQSIDMFVRDTRTTSTLISGVDNAPPRVFGVCEVSAGKADNLDEKRKLTNYESSLHVLTHNKNFQQSVEPETKQIDLRPWEHAEW